MRVKKYVIDRISDITKQFENVKCSYRFDVFSETHYIEILPNSFFKNSEELDTLRADIFDEFDERYADQAIVFISDDSLTKIGKAEYILEGKRFSKAAGMELNWFKQISDSLKHNVKPLIKGGLSEDNKYALAA